METSSSFVSETPIIRRSLELSLLCRGIESLRPPIFQEHFLSGIDNGRDGRIKARSGLGSVGRYPRLQREISRFAREPVQILNQG